MLSADTFMEKIGSVVEENVSLNIHVCQTYYQYMASTDYQIENASTTIIRLLIFLSTKNERIRIEASKQRKKSRIVDIWEIGRRYT